MTQSIWKRFFLTILTALSVCGSALAAGAIPVPKPGRIGSPLPRPTVPIGGYQNHRPIPTPVYTPVTPARPVQLPRIPLRPIVQPMTRSLAPTGEQLGVFKPQLTLFSWASPRDIGTPVGLSRLHDPSWSLAWWKPESAITQADVARSRLARLMEDVK